MKKSLNASLLIVSLWLSAFSGHASNKEYEIIELNNDTKKLISLKEIEIQDRQNPNSAKFLYEKCFSIHYYSCEMGEYMTKEEAENQNNKKSHSAKGLLPHAINKGEFGLSKYDANSWSNFKKAPSFDTHDLATVLEETQTKYMCAALYTMMHKEGYDLEDLKMKLKNEKNELKQEYSFIESLDEKSDIKILLNTYIYSKMYDYEQESVKNNSCILN